MSETKKTAWCGMYLKLHEGAVMVDEMLTMESDLLRRCYKSEYHGELSLKIKNSILKKVIDFCKKRAEIRIQHKDDDDLLLLQAKLKDFDSDFLKPFQTDDAALFHLMDAACKLEINRLLELLLDDVVDILTHKTPAEDIGKFFFIHYNGSDRLLNSMKDIIAYTRWVL